jgi:hypothetical protein
MSPKTKSITSWALYDWANSAFATVVMADLVLGDIKSPDKADKYLHNSQSGV